MNEHLCGTLSCKIDTSLLHALLGLYCFTIETEFTFVNCDNCFQNQYITNTCTSTHTHTHKLHTPTHYTHTKPGKHKRTHTRTHAHTPTHTRTQNKYMHACTQTPTQARTHKPTCTHANSRINAVAFPCQTIQAVSDSERSSN